MKTLIWILTQKTNKKTFWLRWTWFKGWFRVDSTCGRLKNQLAFPCGHHRATWHFTHLSKCLWFPSTSTTSTVADSSENKETICLPCRPSRLYSNTNRYNTKYSLQTTLDVSKVLLPELNQFSWPRASSLAVKTKHWFGVSHLLWTGL